MPSASKPDDAESVRQVPEDLEGDKSADSPEFQECLRSLIRIGRERGGLTFDLVNEALPDELGADPETLEEILTRLEAMGISVRDTLPEPSIAASAKGEASAKEKTGKENRSSDDRSEARMEDGADHDSLKMYFREMGKNPLLTAEVEEQLFLEIRRAEDECRKLLMHFGFTARAQLSLAKKILTREERVDRNVIESSFSTPQSYRAQIYPVVNELESSIEQGESGQYPNGSRDRLSAITQKLAFKDDFFRSLYPLVTHWIEKANSVQSGHPSVLERLVKEFTTQVWMPPEQFLPLARRFQEWQSEAETSKQQMIEANLRLVISVAKNYVNRGVSLLDLVQEGNIGLIKAVDRFDPSLGNRFSTYATWWIRQAVTRCVSEQSRTVRIPSHMIDLISKLGGVRQQLATVLGRDATAPEIAQQMNLTVEKVEMVLEVAQFPISIETPIGDGENTLGDLLEDPNSSNPGDQTSYLILKKRLGQILDTLSDREKSVLEKRFGLANGEVKTLEEVSADFGVTRERIRQIEAKALKKLRHPSRRQHLDGLID